MATMPILSDEHRHMLYASGLSDAAIDARGYYSAPSKAHLKQLGFSDRQAMVPALVIPMQSVDGVVAGHQIRPDVPRELKGRKLKYETPTGGRNMIDVPAPIHSKLREVDVPLIITEGSKKADRACQEGLCCIALPGVWGWKSANGEVSDWDRIALRSRRVFVCFDSDVTENPKVAQAMRRLGAMLSRRGANVFYVQIPSPDGRKVGLDDYLLAGGDPSALFTTCASSEPPVFISEFAFEPSKYEFTDLGNVKRFIDNYGADLRYVHTWRTWMYWDGKRWKKDECGGAVVYQMVAEMIDEMLIDAAAIEDAEEKKDAVKWALASQSKKRMDWIVEAARGFSPVPAAPSDFDKDPDLFNALNGTLHTLTMEFREHRREDMLTQIADAEYDPEADAPTWAKFLMRIFDKDVDLIRYVGTAAGYTLNGRSTEKCMFFLYGSKGNNGKTVFIESLSTVLGDYACTAATESFMAKDFSTGGGGPSSDIARLVARRLVTAPEAEQGKKLDTALIKKLTGGDKIIARFLHASEFEFFPQFTIWMTGNSKPAIYEIDDATWTRMHIIEFKVQIPPEEQDKHLIDKLRAERSGILNWMIMGMKHYNSYGLIKSSSVVNAIEEYREESDILAGFIAEHVRVIPTMFLPSSSLFDAYVKWAKESGLRPMSNKWLTAQMRARGYAYKRTNTARGFEDMALVHEDDGTTYRGGE